MGTSADDIAEELRAAEGDVVKTQEVLARRFAEQIELRHVPPLESDGPIAARLFVEVAGREVAAVERALPDRVTDGDVTVDGDVIRVQNRTQGTLSDGTSVDVRTDTRFTVADGEIVGLESNMDAASMEAWGTVLAAGGLELPADF
jgi:ketosteroid isomerase-like protein